LALAQHAIDPVAPLVERARAERVIGNDREAMRWYQRVLEVDPGHLEAHAELAEEHPKVIRILTTSGEHAGNSETMIAARRATVVILAPWDRQTLSDALA